MHSKWARVQPLGATSTILGESASTRMASIGPIAGTVSPLGGRMSIPSVASRALSRATIPHLSASGPSSVNDLALCQRTGGRLPSSDSTPYSLWYRSVRARSTSLPFQRPDGIVHRFGMSRTLSV